MDWDSISDVNTCQDKCLETEGCVGWTIVMKNACFLKSKLENKGEVSETYYPVVSGPKHCPIHGGWTDWQYFSKCKDEKRKGFRFCTNPEPEYGGKDCEGETVIIESCSSLALASIQARHSGTCLTPWAFLFSRIRVQRRHPAVYPHLSKSSRVMCMACGT